MICELFGKKLRPKHKLNQNVLRKLPGITSPFAVLLVKSLDRPGKLRIWGRIDQVNAHPKIWGISGWYPYLRVHNGLGWSDAGPREYCNRRSKHYINETSSTEALKCHQSLDEYLFSILLLVSSIVWYYLLWILDTVLSR